MGPPHVDMPPRRRGGAPASSPDGHEFPSEHTPSPIRRAATLGPTGYAPAGLRFDLHPDLLASSEVQHNPPPGPTTYFRNLLVVSVPRAIMLPGATRWGDFNMSSPVCCVNARMVAFVCKAVSLAAADAPPGQVRVFVELVVHKTFGLPYGNSIADYSAKELADNVYAPPNAMGHRLWIILGPGAVHPEALMRSAIFEAQGAMELVSWSSIRIKKQILTVDEAARPIVTAMVTAAILDLRRKSAASAEKRKRARHEGEAERAEEEEEKEEEGGVDDSERSKASALAVVRYAIGEAPLPHLLHKLTTRRVLHVENLWTGVAFVGVYLRHVIMATHILAGTASSGDTLWGAATEIAKPDGEGTWLPSISPDVAATERWGFNASAATFYDDELENCVCPKQLQRGSYELDNDALVFPYRHLVWELSPNINPLDFFGTSFPWKATRFEAEVTRLAMRLHDEESRAILLRPVESGAPVAEKPELFRSSRVAAMARTTNDALPSEYAEVQRAIASRAASSDDVAHSHRVQREAAEHRFAVLELTRDYTAEPLMISRASEGRTVTESIVASTIPLYSGYVAKMNIVSETVAKLTVPLGHDPETWRYMRMLELHSLYRTDLFNAMLSLIIVGEGIFEVHRSMYVLLSRENSVSKAYAAEWCRLPQMSIEANALVGAM